MAEDTTGGTGQADDIQEQITQALEEINQIRNTRQVITDPDGLEACERAILQATDKLAALMTALKIQPVSYTHLTLPTN